jgi:ribokinase
MIHVIGNATIDTVIRLSRFPVPGETLVATGSHEDFGGKGANQAVVVARCGSSVRLLAAIGKDEAGQRIAAHLAAEGVDTGGLREWAGRSDRCIIYVDDAGENTIVSSIDAATAFDPFAMTGIAHEIAAGDYVLLQGNLRSDVTRRCLAFAKKRSATTILNPSPTYPDGDYDWRSVDLAILNRVEAMELGAGPDHEHSAAALLDAGAGAVVITLGAAGATWIARDRVIHADAPEVHAIDTVGAGDVFCGVLLASLAGGRSPEAALRAAVEAAAITVTRSGVVSSFPSSAEMRQILRFEEPVR